MTHNICMRKIILINAVRTMGDSLPRWLYIVLSVLPWILLYLTEWCYYVKILPGMCTEG